MINLARVPPRRMAPGRPLPSKEPRKQRARQRGRRRSRVRGLPAAVEHDTPGTPTIASLVAWANGAAVCAPRKRLFFLSLLGA